jgi:hypothetical protein
VARGGLRFKIDATFKETTFKTKKSVSYLKYKFELGELGYQLTRTSWILCFLSEAIDFDDQNTRSHISLKDVGIFMQPPPALTFRNSAFCPQNVFMRFARFSLQTAIVSLNAVNRLIFVTVKCSVFFAVRTEFLNTFRITVSASQV